MFKEKSKKERSNNVVYIKSRQGYRCERINKGIEMNECVSGAGDGSRRKRGKWEFGVPKKMPPGRGLASDVLPAANDRVPLEGRKAHDSSIKAFMREEACEKMRDHSN